MGDSMRDTEYYNKLIEALQITAKYYDFPSDGVTGATHEILCQAENAIKNLLDELNAIDRLAASANKIKPKCQCYRTEYGNNVCYGTKEKEICSCGGDRHKCDFYEEVRNT